MRTDGSVTVQTAREEVVNSVTHGVGAALAIAGVAVLVTLAAQRGTAWHVVGCSIFGGSLVLLYVASTLYHAVPSPRAKRVLQTLDHTGILFLIAGTYTPFTLVTLRGPWGWSLFGVVWGLAATGVLLELMAPRRRVLAVALYLVMGWAMVVALRPLMAGIAAGGMRLLALGGVAYTLGVVFYAWRGLRYHHALWHGFVLVGSAAHFFAVLYYVVPRAT
ncbi:MAG: hemolysin III family protein [Gemmatimonadota bacterium]|nr:hemolysin III family protein [Gemmatimonadota bacterium]MDH4349878.1 hemolysin III family protein [Gemmatimonadota bacterium]